MRNFAKVLGLACAPLAAINAQAQQKLAPPDANAPAAVTITVTNRSGGPILGQVITQIGKLRKDPRFSPYLAPAQPDETQTDCIGNARKDPSGRLFDVARCMQVWPEVGKAPTLKNLETSFARGVIQRGPAALPGVSVTPFVYSQLVNYHEFTKFRGQRFEGEGPDIKPTDKFLDVLCDKTWTLISEDDCKARVKVVDRMFYDPDIFVGQTGYKVEVLNKMPRATALAFSKSLESGIHLDPGIRKDALRVTVSDETPVRPQQLPPVGEVTAPAAAQLNPVDQLWDVIHARPSSVELSPDSNATAPALLLFDYSKEPGPIANWVQGLNSGLTQLVSGSCPAGDAESAHTDAVASLLMPGGMAALLSAKANSNTKPLPVPSFPSFIFTPGQFDGESVSGNYPWFNGEGLGRAPDAQEPVVALVVYDAGMRTDSDRLTKDALDHVLLNSSNIVVVSAASWSKTPLPSFPPRQPTDDLKKAQYSCKTLPWPSCLGIHPRVLVVGPTTAPSDNVRSGFATDKYVLGGGVGVGAPSVSIPVVARCGGETVSWSASVRDGTSFGAPLVALLLAKIIQLSPERVRSSPETAILRVEATANPLGAADDDSPMGFGEVDAGRALRGVSVAETGAWDNAALYEVGQDPAKPAQAVVMPYPWNDVPKLLEATDGAAGKMGMENLPRSAITFTSFNAAGERSDTLSLAFNAILRIARRKDTTPGQGQLFDVYYLNDDNTKLRYLKVMRRVRFGPANLTIGNQSYCRADGTSAPAEVAGSDIQPSCLYVWRSGAAGFEPLELARVQDIVFPPTHARARFIGGISFLEIADVVQQAGSPWATEFCQIGVRKRVADALARKGKPTDKGKLCRVVAAGPTQ